MSFIPQRKKAWFLPKAFCIVFLLSLPSPAVSQGEPILSDAEFEWIEQTLEGAKALQAAFNAQFERLPTLVTEFRTDTARLRPPLCERLQGSEHFPDGPDGDSFAGYTCALEFERTNTFGVTTFDPDLQNNSITRSGDGSLMLQMFGPAVDDCPAQTCPLLPPLGETAQPHGMQFITQAWLTLNSVGRMLTGDETLEVMTRRDFLDLFSRAMKLYREDEGLKAFLADTVASAQGSGDPRHFIYLGQMAKRFSFSQQDACQVGLSFAGHFYLFCRTPSFATYFEDT